MYVDENKALKVCTYSPSSGESIITSGTEKRISGSSEVTIHRFSDDLKKHTSAKTGKYIRYNFPV